MRNVTRLSLKFLAVCLSVVPPALATLSYFPLWREGGKLAVVSGFTLVLLLFSFAPLLKLFKKFLKSPTARELWLVLFIIFFALSKIADEMVVISLVGYLGNLLASLIWKATGRAKNGGKALALAHLESDGVSEK